MINKTGLLMCLFRRGLEWLVKPAWLAECKETFYVMLSLRFWWICLNFRNCQDFFSQCVFFFFLPPTDDDYLQNASTILDKLKSYYRQGGESLSLSKVLQDFTQVLLLHSRQLNSASQWVCMFVFSPFIHFSKWIVVSREVYLVVCVSSICFMSF